MIARVFDLDLDLDLDWRLDGRWGKGRMLPLPVGKGASVAVGMG